MRKAVLAGMTLAVLTGLSACATPTPYQALAERPEAGGYSDTLLAVDRYQVAFVGNSDTTEAMVDRYMLYRAAELALANGYDWFTLADRKSVREANGNGDAEKARYSIPYSNPTYFPRDGSTIVASDTGSGRRFSVTGDTATYHFKASAEVQFGRGEKPAGKPAAFDARDVMARMAPKVAARASAVG